MFSEAQRSSPFYEISSQDSNPSFSHDRASEFPNS